MERRAKVNLNPKMVLVTKAIQRRIRKKQRIALTKSRVPRMSSLVG